MRDDCVKIVNTGVMTVDCNESPQPFELCQRCGQPQQGTQQSRRFDPGTGAVGKQTLLSFDRATTALYRATTTTGRLSVSRPANWSQARSRSPV